MVHYRMLITIHKQTLKYTADVSKRLNKTFYKTQSRNENYTDYCLSEAITNSYKNKNITPHSVYTKAKCTLQPE